MLYGENNLAFVDGQFVEVAPSMELLALTTAVERFCDSPGASRPGAAIAEDLKQLGHLCDLLKLEFAKRSAEFAASGEADRYSDSGAAEWIRHECHMSVTDAYAAVCVGEQMVALPASTERVVNGDIGYSHLALMAATARAVGESACGTPFDETPLLAQAIEHSVSRFRFDCANARHAADASGFLAEHVEAVERRRLELLPCADGFVVRGWLDAVGGASFRAAIEPLARRAGKHDKRLRARRMADGAIELANHQLDTGTLPSQGGQRPHVQVTATLETVMGLPGAPAGHMQFASAIPAETVRRLACDSGVTRVLFDTRSEILDVGRSKRVPSAPTRRALAARDKGCVWPSCDRPPAWTNAHHVKHWADGGVTEIPNLILVCLRHHQLLHEGGWKIAQSDDGRWLTIPPLPRGQRWSAGGDAYQKALELRAP